MRFARLCKSGVQKLFNKNLIGDASKNISVPIFFPGAFQGSTIYILINKLNIELQCTFMDYMGQKHCYGLYGSTSGPALVSLHQL